MRSASSGGEASSACSTMTEAGRVTFYTTGMEHSPTSAGLTAQVAPAPLAASF